MGNAIVPYEALDVDLQATLDAKAEIADLSDYVTTTDYELSVDGLQVLEDASTDLATKALEFITRTSNLESRINDAGIVINPDDGSVSIQTVSALDERVNTVEVDLDAVENELTLKASTTYVNNQIAAAVLDSSDLASLNDLEGRVDDVEITLDGGGDIIAATSMVEGTAYTIYTVGTTNFTNFGASANTIGTTFYATGSATGTGQVQEAGATARIGLVASGLSYSLVDGELSVSELSGSITTLQGEIDLKASSTDLDSVEGRVTTAEQNLSAIDAASITQNLVDLRGIADKTEDLSQLTLKEVLGRYADRKYLTSDIAIARTQLTADVNDQKEAIAQQKLELAASIAGNTASIEETNTALADETSARVELETNLQAQVDDANATLTEVTTLDATAGHAVVDQFLQLKADVEDPNTGLTAAYGEINELNNVDVGSTSALVQSHLQLDATVNDPTTGLAAAQASIDEINTITADSNSAAAEAIYSLESTVNNPSTGVAATASAVSSLDTRVTNAEGDITSVASDVTSLTTTVGNNTSSISTVASSVNGIEAKYGVTIDNNGILSGFQLLSGAGTPSAFNVRADQFNLYSTDGTTSDVPFSVFTTSQTVNGVTYPAGVYMDTANVFGTLSANQIQIDDVTLDTDGSGNLIIKSGGVSTDRIADSAVTTLPFAKAGVIKSLDISAPYSYSNCGSTTVAVKKNSKILWTVSSSGYTSGTGGDTDKYAAVELRLEKFITANGNAGSGNNTQVKALGFGIIQNGANTAMGFTVEEIFDGSEVERNWTYLLVARVTARDGTVTAVYLPSTTGFVGIQAKR